MAVKLLVRSLTVEDGNCTVTYNTPMLLIGHGPENWNPGTPPSGPIPFTPASITPFTRETPGTLYLPSLTIRIE